MRMLEGLRFGARQGIPHLTRWAPATSEAGGRTEAIGRKTDIADGMSEAEGRPDVPEAWSEGLGVAISSLTPLSNSGLD